MTATLPVSIAGKTLAETGQALPPIRSPGPPPGTMTRLIRTSARDRWLSGIISYYTPQIVESTARSALSGNLFAQWLMFDLMEQTSPRISKNFNELKDAVVSLDRIFQ